MISYKRSHYLTQFIERQKAAGKKIGFVPTMGALHAGHISLIEAAKKECNIVVCSIFVNPTQFNNPEDLLKYPRTLEADMKLLEAAGCDILFIPSVNEMYPKGTLNFKAPNLGAIVEVLEGSHRPGHFEGVMQVVSLLLDKVQATHLFMGLKDYQQFAICSKMVAHQKRKIVMRGLDTLREANGLAMSSRNVRLSAKGKIKASLIFETLAWVKSNLAQYNISELQVKASEKLSIDADFTLEYFAIVDKDTLQESKNKENLIALCAVWLEGVRLIDNMIL